MSYTVMVEVVKIDEETGKSYSYKVPALRVPDTVPKGEIDYELYLKHMKATCNVGDFLILESKTYRRIRGGWRAATDDDLAELLAAKLGEALEEKSWNYRDF